jgi:hypothetical protein
MSSRLSRIGIERLRPRLNDAGNDAGVERPVLLKKSVASTVADEPVPAPVPDAPPVALVALEGEGVPWASTPVPGFCWRSDPAKSTRESEEVHTRSPAVARSGDPPPLAWRRGLLRVTCSIRITKTAWLRLDVAFIKVVAVRRLAAPRASTCSASFDERSRTSFRFSTNVPRSTDSRILGLRGVPPEEIIVEASVSSRSLQRKGRYQRIASAVGDRTVDSGRRRILRGRGEPRRRPAPEGGRCATLT